MQEHSSSRAGMMKRAWFKSWGWIYRPVSPAAWVAVILTLLFLVNTFLAIDRHSHSASDTLYGIFPYWIPALGILNWIAGRTSETDGCVDITTAGCVPEPGTPKGRE